MTTATDYLMSGHIGPWSEDEYLALGETPDRIELLDGDLHVSPAPTPRHQNLSRRLANALEDAASAHGFVVYEAVNVRLKRNRMPIPDLVVGEGIDPDKLVVDTSLLQIVCEITSPSNAAYDRVTKMNFYAEAGIPWYLLVDVKPELVLRLFRLESGHYMPHGEGRDGEPLRMTEPFPVELDPAILSR